MRVDPNISDLFFNTDVDAARRYDKKGHFDCFDHGTMMIEAGHVLGCLERLGVPNLPTADDLVADFLARV